MNNKLKSFLFIITAAALVLMPVISSYAETAAHTYDDLNRLIRSEYSDGTIIIYDYDKLGNRTSKRKFYKPHVLTVTKTGSGSGTVTSSPARINCGAVCAETFSEGTPITLTAVPDASSRFIEWSGAGCSGTGACIVTMNAATTVAVIFQPSACTNLPVRIGSTYYSSLQAAYNAASNGAVIQSQNVTLAESLNADRPISVTLDGGYSCDYSVKTGATSFMNMTTSNTGAITLKNFILQ